MPAVKLPRRADRAGRSRRRNIRLDPRRRAGL